MIGPVESDPEYKLIVQANNLSVEIDNEISKFFITTFIAVSFVCLKFLFQG